MSSFDDRYPGCSLDDETNSKNVVVIASMAVAAFLLVVVIIWLVIRKRIAKKKTGSVPFYLTFLLICTHIYSTNVPSVCSFLGVQKLHDTIDLHTTGIDDFYQSVAVFDSLINLIFFFIIIYILDLF